MILVKASAGLVIELGVGASGRFDALSVRLRPEVAAQPLRFEVAQANDGRLLVRSLDARRPGELMAALTAVADNESNILAEVRKYGAAGA
jgi:hypothetical protein